MNVVNISDLEHPEHEGKSYRQVNAEKEHQISIGTLVEIVSEDDASKYDGMRLYVIGHHRDCDQTPLYALGYQGQEMWDNGRFFNGSGNKFHNPKTLHGFPENSLRIVE